MGGYGTVKIALSRPGSFKAAAALSGTLDFENFQKLVREGVFPDTDGIEFDILNEDKPLIDLAKEALNSSMAPDLLIQCGTDDFLYQDNRRFTEQLREMGYPYTYKEDPGDHAWPYWDKAIQYALRFFLGLDLDEKSLY